MVSKAHAHDAYLEHNKWLKNRVAEDYGEIAAKRTLAEFIETRINGPTITITSWERDAQEPRRIAERCPFVGQIAETAHKTPSSQTRRRDSVRVLCHRKL
jgi:hypothetical protein